jgi:hypothetical protein
VNMKDLNRSTCGESALNFRNTMVSSPDLVFKFSNTAIARGNNTNIPRNHSQFYNGEPVRTIYGRGYVVYSYDVFGVPFVKVKLKFGYGFIR